MRVEILVERLDAPFELGELPAVGAGEVDGGDGAELAQRGAQGGVCAGGSPRREVHVGEFTQARHQQPAVLGPHRVVHAGCELADEAVPHPDRVFEPPGRHQHVGVGAPGGDPQRGIVNPKTFSFPPDGFEISYAVSTFAANFARVLFVLWVKLAFLAMLGICAATFLAFPALLAVQAFPASQPRIQLQ